MLVRDVFTLDIADVSLNIDIEFVGESFDGSEEVDAVDVLNEINDIARSAADEAVIRTSVINDELRFIAVAADGADASELTAARRKVGKLLGVFDKIDLINDVFDVKTTHKKPYQERD